jgi:hypothetical protein
MISWACSRRAICADAPSRPRGARGISVVSATSRHGDAHAAEQLNALGERTTSAACSPVLVEQQMQRVEGRARHLPVVLVEIASVIVSAST